MKRVISSSFALFYQPIASFDHLLTPFLLVQVSTLYHLWNLRFKRGSVQLLFQPDMLKQLRVASCLFLLFYFFGRFDFVLLLVYLFENKCKKCMQIYIENSQIKFEFCFLSTSVTSSIQNFFISICMINHLFKYY